jgi:magnesium-transporting ATPase (P-type)
MTTEQQTDGALSPRLQEFQREVDALKVSGGKANPERSWTIIGGLLMFAGIIITLIAWLLTHGSSNPLEQADYGSLGTFGLVLAIVGTALFVVMSLRRYFRYWLVRLIYEQREQTDRLSAR